MNVSPATTAPTRVTELMAEVFAAKPEDPTPLYNELREIGDGVHYFAPADGWFAFRYDHVQRIGREEKIFSSDFFHRAPMGIHNPEDPEHVRFIDFSSRLMAFTDPPRHDILRNAVRKAFLPKAISHWRSMVERSVDVLLDQFTPGQEVDFVNQLSIDVPVEAICAVLGVENVDREMIRAGSEGLAATFDPAIVGDARDKAIRNALRMVDHIDSVIAERRALPKDDLISMVVEAQSGDGEDTLCDADIRAQLVFLLAAGNETTVNLLSNGINQLLTNPPQRALLQGDHSLVQSFMNETLRLDTPIDIGVPRLTRESTTMGETAIPEGVYIFQVFASANRDPRKFDQPEEFRIDRAPNPILTFNQGVHSCIGAPLARLEGEVFFSRFMTRFPDFAAGNEPAQLRAGHAMVRGLESLPVRL